MPTVPPINTTPRTTTSKTRVLALRIGTLVGDNEGGVGEGEKDGETVGLSVGAVVGVAVGL